MATQIYYRIRIRDAADTGDALVISSVPGGTNPYVLKPFSGAGRTFDPLEGSVDTGAYTAEVIDATTGANTRVVTAVLADANARQQLLSRRAYGETSANGSSWTPLFGGYVQGARLTSPLVFVFTIGETRRIATDREVFKSTILTADYAGKPLTFSQFDKVTCIFGGPIRGDWLWVRDMGGWKFKVSQAPPSAPYVQLKLVKAFDPTKPEHGSFSTLSSAIVDAMCNRAAPYYRESPKWKPQTIRGYFPGIVYRVETLTGTFVGNFTPLAEPVHPDKATPPNIFTRTGEASIWLDWVTTPPTVGTQYNVYMYPTDISEDNPLHIFEHPVDLLQKLWDEAGVAYDSSVLAGVRSSIGDELRLGLRITQSPGSLRDFQKQICGLFGMATRSDGTGREVLFAHRIKLSSSPGTTITVNDLRDSGGTVFDLDESTVCNKVTIKQKRLTQRIATDESPVDQIIVVDQSFSVENSAADMTAYGKKEIVYEIEGQILTSKTQPDFDLEKYTLGVAREIFDRWGRGAIGGDLHCLPSVTTDVGQEVLVNIPQLPNAVVGATPVSQRGGSRIVQVVGRTETPSGPDLRVLDSGTTAQPVTAPTFNATLNADDPFHFVDLELTNAVALATAGYTVRVEIAVGAGTPTVGTLLTNLDLSQITAAMASLTVAQAAALTVAQAAAYSAYLPGVRIPGHDSGTKVWTRMRSEKEGYRPSTWTSFTGVQLSTLNAVTALAVSAEDAADPSKRTLTWTIGANAADYPVEVLLRLTSDSSAADRLMAILPKGSTRYVLTELDNGNRTATVRHREKAPFNGVSSDSTIAVNTTLAAATLAAPTNPIAFAGRVETNGKHVPEGTYGIDVNASVYPCGVEIAVKVGSGAYETREIVQAQPSGATKWRAVAPNDGQVRTLKARHVLAGYTSSVYTAEVTVTPYGPQQRWPDVFDAVGAQLINVQAKRAKPTLAVGNGADTTAFGINRHNDEQSGKDGGATKSFGVTYDVIPQMRALPQNIQTYKTGVVADQSLDVRAINVSVSTYDTRAKLITGQTSSAKSNNPAATLNGTPVASVAITAYGAVAYWDLADANGVLTTYYAHFDVDTTIMDWSNILYVELYRNNGTASTTWTLVDSKMYSAGATLTNQTMSFDYAMTLDWDLRILIYYLNAPGSLVATVTAKACTYDQISTGSESDATAGAGAAVLFQAMEAP